MALDKTRWGDSIAAAVKSLGITAGEPITDNQLKQVWQKVAEASKSEINENAGIQLEAADITVPATGLNSPTGPVTGTASVAAMTEKIGRIK